MGLILDVLLGMYEPPKPEEPKRYQPITHVYALPASAFENIKPLDPEIIAKI